MGRPKSFSREEVLEKAMPVFWKHGFADTTLQDLKRATGVNKSGLYTGFRDKEDLFVHAFGIIWNPRRGEGFLLRSLSDGTTSKPSSAMVLSAGLLFRQLNARARHSSG